MPTLPDATTLCTQIAAAMRPQITPQTALVGIHTGGARIAEWLHRELGVTQPLGSIDVAFYRDDYNQRGLHKGAKASNIPFDVEGAHIVIVDDRSDRFYSSEIGGMRLKKWRERRGSNLVGNICTTRYFAEG